MTPTIEKGYPAIDTGSSSTPSEPPSWRHSACDTTTTGSRRDRTSEGPSARPLSGATPSVEKKSPDTCATPRRTALPPAAKFTVPELKKPVDARAGHSAIHGATVAGRSPDI